MSPKTLVKIEPGKPACPDCKKMRPRKPKAVAVLVESDENF